MLSKLTKEEIRYAKKEITKLSKMEKKQLSAKIDEETKKYEQLPMVDSYILHVISDINFCRGLNDLNETIREQISENKVVSNKSLINALNPCIKK